MRLPTPHLETSMAKDSLEERMQGHVLELLGVVQMTGLQ